MSERVRDTVLVVDDSEDFRELIVMIGKLYGVPVLEAADCRQALDVLSHEGARIKLIMLDYFMPGMKPAMCAQALREKTRQSVNIVLVTAVADPAVRAAELQISRWIAKPVEPSTLRELMTQDSWFRKPA
jgi:two-component system chemotaxis response regulator CheY